MPRVTSCATDNPNKTPRRVRRLNFTGTNSPGAAVSFA